MESRRANVTREIVGLEMSLEISDGKRGLEVDLWHMRKLLRTATKEGIIRCYLFQSVS